MKIFIEKKMKIFIEVIIIKSIITRAATQLADMRVEAGKVENPPQFSSEV